MDALQKQPLKSGLVNIPGSTPGAAQLAGELLYKDYLLHHTYFNDKFFHNHLSHHILALYDVGAPESAIQKAFDIHSKYLRGLLHGNEEQKAVGTRVTEENWRETLGEKHPELYPDYLAFFAKRIAKHGVRFVLEKYIFAPEANEGGALMLGRFFGGLAHPLIQTGYGIEFDQDYMVAQGLALTAVTNPEGKIIFEDSGLAEVTSAPASIPLLSLFAELQSRADLTPMPFPGDLVPQAELSFMTLVDWITQQPAHGAIIREVFAQWSFELSASATEDQFEKKIDECLWLASLLLGATTPSGRPARMDFFLMHGLTSALTLRPMVRLLTNPLHKAQLLIAYARTVALLWLMRGSPRVDCSVVMSYPLPPAKAQNTSGNPWFTLVDNAIAHTEPHVVKAVRALYHAAQHFGAAEAGMLVAKNNTNFNGLEKVDGTLFLRVAGVMTDALGWPLYEGEEAQRFWNFDGFWEKSWAN